ncbi:Chitinase [Minicystis rosea]|nr:Chitinase [Minicystis rosea]
MDPAHPPQGNYQTLFDEQSLAGDPVFGTAGAPVTSWGDQSWVAADYPAGFYIDLGDTYVVTHLAYFDTFNTGPVYFDIGAPGAWTNEVSDSSDGWQSWKIFSVGEQTRYIRFSRGMFAGVNEILVYGYPAGGTPPPNQPPTVSVGSSQTITLPVASVSLSGTASDPDGTIASYQWSQISGPSTASLQGAGTATATASGLVAGTYSFKLTVTDDDGATASATKSVIVNAAPSGNGTTTEVYASSSTPGYYGYVKYLPPGYDGSANWPVVFFLHGQGQTGNGSASQLYKVRANGPQHYIDTEGKQYPFILISPQTNGSWGSWEQQYYMNPFVDHIKQTLKVDPKRVYMTGLSLGGGGTWAYAQLFPEKLAGIVTACAGYYGATDADGAKLVNQGVAVWSFHGLKDTTLNEGGDVAWFDAIGHALGANTGVKNTYQTGTTAWYTSFYRPATHNWEWIPGQTSVDGNNAPASYPAHLTLYPLDGHFIWDSVYKDQNVWDWLLAQARP